MKEGIKNHFKGRNLIKEIGMDSIGSLLYAIGIYYFAINANFAPGGISGAAIIINYFFNIIPIGTISVLLNIPIILGTKRFLGISYLVRTARTLLINAFFMDVIVPQFGKYQGMPLLAAMYAGAFAGAGLAIIYNNNTCTGGTDLIIMAARKVKPHLSIGQITIIIDGLIIFTGWIVFKNIDAVLFGFLFTVAETLVIDKLMYGFNAGKLTMIISDYTKEIAEAISNEIDRTSTRLPAKGGYSGDRKEVLLCATKRTEQARLNKLVKNIDRNAFVIILDYSEVRGYGFKPFD